MADGRGHKKKTTAGETHPPPLSRKAFEATTEFARFKEGMKHLLSVPKERIDQLVRESKEKSPRRDNPRAPGRKISKRADDA